jgi:hypothetical protein
MDTDIWVVQTRRKGAYVNRLTTNNEGQAYFYYRCLNMGNGYRKRLCLNGRTIEKYAS